MGRFLIKIKDLYFQWSTVVDAPISYGMTLDELNKYIRFNYGQKGIDDLPQRLERIEKTGCSGYNETLEGIESYNRAGEEENILTLDEIYTKYGYTESLGKDKELSQEKSEVKDGNK